MSTDRTPTHHRLWYKDAVIYQLHVRTFFDSNGDGTGDFEGLISKLDYILALGVNTLWVMPFFQSPGDDDGYDVTDFEAVDARYGRLNDFKAFITAAHERGLRVIVELVLNHTSDDHPWFQRARRAAPGSEERDFYVWSTDDRKYSDARVIFKDSENSNWTWDPIANSHYWHRFYEHQPDLNYNNPRVVQSIIDVMHYWLDLGVDGFRLDAVPYLMERDETPSESLPETHEILKLIRESICGRRPDVVLLAEANQQPATVMEYFGDGDECQMAFHFPLMPQLFMAMAKGSSDPIKSVVDATKDIPASCQWAIFLRNHDELSLEMVSDIEREELLSAYAPHEKSRLNLGIRHRLAPLMQSDRRRIELMHALLLSLPGSPVLYYGDEIGMGDDVELDDRHGVRTPMQWSRGPNAGFSTHRGGRLTLPVIDRGPHSFEHVNVEAQEADGSSLLNWVRKAIAVRRENPCLAHAECQFLEAGDHSVLSYLRAQDGNAVLCIFNLSATDRKASFSRLEGLHDATVQLGHAEVEYNREGVCDVRMRPYQYAWIRLGRARA